MKRMKKVLALVVAIMMVMTMMSFVSFAEGEAYDTPLTVTGLTDGDTVAFYQVIEWVGNEEGNVSGWKAVAPFDTVLTESKLKEVLVGNSSTPATGITSELAGKLVGLVQGDGTPGVISEDGKTATLNNTEPGMWLGLVTPVDANTIYNPVFVSSDYNKDAGGTVAMGGKYADAVAKSSTVDLTKTASTTEDTWDDNKPNTTAVGDTVSFTVNTTIPGYGNVYDSPHFAVKDTLSGLKLNADSVTVKDLDAENYSVDATDSGYTITFTPAYLKTLAAATPVVIEYSAIVTTDAKNGVNEEVNEVSIEYSHDPTDETDYDVKKDTTQHYTFSIDAEGDGTGTTFNGKKTSEVVKVGVDAAGNPITEITEESEISEGETWNSPLAGAKFGLYTDEACQNAYKPKNADGTEGSTAMVATTGADGRMNFKGLDAGTYYLKEIEAPAGFVTNPEPVEVKIVATTKTVTITEWWNGEAWVSTEPASGTAKKVTYETEILESYTVTIDGQETATYKFNNPEAANSNEINWEIAELEEKPYQFVNTQGTELPSTGGIGTTLFYIIGAILVIGGAILLISRKRTNA